jgi:hypothetical protein
VTEFLPADDLKPYLDDDGRIREWPSARNRKAAQTLVLDYLIGKFAYGYIYTEREVNDLLNRYHTFGDPALLRRELISWGLLGRLPDGSQYWRIDNP